MRYRILGAVRLPSETRDGGSREWVAYETGLVTEKAVSKREVQRIEQKIDIPKDASGLNDRLLETLIDVYPHSPACQMSLVCLKSRNPDIPIRAYRSLEWENCGQFGVVCTANLQVPGLFRTGR